MKNKITFAILTLAIALLCFFPAKSQVISKIDFGLVNKTINQPGKGYYDSLAKRLNNADTTLLAADYKNCYYGQIFWTSYEPLNESEALQPVRILLAVRDLDSAARFLDNYLKIHPASLGAIYAKLTLLNQKKDKDGLKKWTVIYKGLVQAILDSGDGKTEATAMVIVNITDQYKVMPALGVTPTAHQLTDNHFDKQTLAQPTRDGTGTLYFNIATIVAKGHK